MEYQVSERLRKVQLVELDLIKKFKAICEKHHLKYYAFGGTCLGTVRHQGFIPWDDDVDIAMEWPDYQKFLQIGPSECEYPYYFQSYLTEECADILHVRMRRTDTTGISEWEYQNIKDPNHNMGIWIDIMPLFNVPPADMKELREAQKEKIFKLWQAIKGYYAVTCMQYGYPPFPKYIPFISDYEEMSRQYTITQMKNMYLSACVWEGESDEIGETAFKTYVEKFIYKREWFEKVIFLPFEDTTLACPEQYDKILTRQYGDWRTPVMNSAFHVMKYADADTPYPEFLKRLKEGERQIPSA